MSVPSRPHRGTRFYAELLEHVIAHAQMSGRSGNYSKLRQRLDRIEQDIEADELQEGRRGLKHAASWFEWNPWMEALARDLIPEVADRLAATLTECEEIPREVWGPLDKDRFEQACRARSRRETTAEVAVILAARACRPTPSFARVEQALAALEELQVLRRETVWDEHILAAAGRHLTMAMGSMLPPTARVFLAHEVEARWRALVGRPAETTMKDETPWRDEFPALEDWHPIWEDVLRDRSETDAVGQYFIPPRQAAYESLHEDRVRHEKERLAAEMQRHQEAEAERERRAAKAARARAREVAALQAELEAWERDAPLRRASRHEENRERAARMAEKELKEELRQRERRLKGIERNQRNLMLEQKEAEIVARLDADDKRQERTEKDRRLEAIASTEHTRQDAYGWTTPLDEVSEASAARATRVWRAP